MKKHLKIFVCALVVVSSLIFSTGFGYPVKVETVIISKGNSEPIAENLQLETYRGVAVGGNLKSVDGENEPVTYEISTQPKHGEVTLYEDGSFIYDPCDTKKSRDSFGYTATDSFGNKSEEAIVSITISKYKKGIEYSDIQSSSCAYAAVYLAENDIYTGECIGGQYFFRPDSPVTKGDFLVMCLKAADHSILNGVTATGLYNDEEMPVWIKSYISSAVLCGCFTDDTVFEYDENVTFEEAAVMIDAIFEITDVISVSAISPYLQADSAQAVNNLYLCGITDESIITELEDTITMEDAAVLLERASKVIENR